MNKEEASFILANIDRRVCDDELNEALDIAIKALEQIPTKEEEALLQKWRDNRGISMEEFEDAMNTLEQEPCEMTAEEYRQRMIQAFHNADTDELIAICVLPTEKEFEHLEWLLKNHYKKEPCGDAIDRAEAIRIASGYCHPANVANELAKLPPVNPQPCEDAISRQAVLDILKREGRKWGNNYRDWVDAIEEIKNLSSVNPTKTGHWINLGVQGEIDGQIVKGFVCSKCGAISVFRMTGRKIINGDLCPGCGAKMVEPQES